MDILLRGLQHLRGLSIAHSQDGRGFSNADFRLGSALADCAQSNPWNDNIRQLAVQLAYRYREQLANYNECSVDGFVRQVVNCAPYPQRMTAPPPSVALFWLSKLGQVCVSCEPQIISLLSNLLGINVFRPESSSFTIIDVPLHLRPEFLEKIDVVTGKKHEMTDELMGYLSSEPLMDYACEVSWDKQERKKVSVHFLRYDPSLLNDLKERLAGAKPVYSRATKKWSVYPVPELLKMSFEYEFLFDRESFRLLSQSINPLSVSVDGDCFNVSILTNVSKDVFAIFQGILGSKYKKRRIPCWIIPMTSSKQLLDAIGLANEMLAQTNQEVSCNSKLLSLVTLPFLGDFKFGSLYPSPNSPNSLLFYCEFNERINHAFKSLSPRPLWNKELGRWVVNFSQKGALIDMVKSVEPDMKIVTIKDY